MCLTCVIGFHHLTGIGLPLAGSLITCQSEGIAKHRHYRFEEEQQWAAQQQAQPSSSSQPQAQSRFAQESMLPVSGAANPKDQALDTKGFGSMTPAPFPGPASTSSLTEVSRPQYVTQEAGPKQASMTRPAQYDDDSMAFQPAQRRVPTHQAVSELEQQGGAAVHSPAGQTTAARRAANPEEVAALSAQNPRGGHRSQHTLSEQEHQGSSAKAHSTVQGSVAQPHLRGPSPQEVELVASHQATASSTRDSPTRDLTELEQQGSFTLAPGPSQSQAGNLDGAGAADMAWELARRKGAQAELERQYSQLQLQHQQVHSSCLLRSTSCCLSVHLSVSVCLCLSVLSVCPSVCMYVCLSVCDCLPARQSISSQT